MSFNTFCNICFSKENIIKLCGEENETIFNILISFTPCQDTVTGVIYLCIKCCNTLEEYDKFRELFLKNFVRFRYLYNELKKQLEISNAPDIQTQLKTFVEVNVERASGTPLIENYEVAQALRKNSTSNADITCKKLDDKLYKVGLDESLINNGLMQGDITFNPENNTSENEIHTCFIKYENVSFDEDPENINKDSIVKKNEPNPDLFEESHDPLVSDTVANNIPYHKSENYDVSNISTNPENSVSDDSTHEEEPTDNENKPRSDTASTIKQKDLHSDKRQHKCDECGLRFIRRNHLNTHKRRHTGEQPYKCNDCGLKFTKRDQIKTIKLRQASEKPFKCDVCGLGFTQRGNLYTHKFIHTGEKPYKCEDCGLNFLRKDHLNRHKRTHTGEKPYKCDDCGLKFTRTDQLNAHKLTHTGEKPYKCDECGMRFIQLSNLNTHKITHTVEKPHKCIDCVLKCTEDDHLNTLNLRDTADKPHKCDECGLRFTEEVSLNKHKFIHTGEKPHKCDDCGLTFTRKDHLNRHKLRHTGEKPYKCDDCGLGFTRKDHLNIHKVTHTGERPYSCLQCDKTFAKKSTLTKHTRTHKY